MLDAELKLISHVFNNNCGRISETDILQMQVPKQSLKEAVKSAPNCMGCYCFFLHGHLVYVGKAEDGIRKRFVQYYNGNAIDYPSGKKIHEKRNYIMASWKQCSSREECRKLEEQLISKYKPEWNERGGWKLFLTL